MSGEFFSGDSYCNYKLQSYIQIAFVITIIKTGFRKSDRAKKEKKQMVESVCGHLVSVFAIKKYYMEF